MAKKVEERKDLFDENVEEVQEETPEVTLTDEDIENEPDVEKADDLKEGFIAEADPRSHLIDPLKKHSGPAEDLVKSSLNKQITALGRITAEKLNDEKRFKKYKVLIPESEFAKNEDYILVGTNGWNMQIKRGVPVMLPDVIIDRLSRSGYNPTLVR